MTEAALDIPQWLRQCRPVKTRDDFERASYDAYRRVLAGEVVHGDAVDRLWEIAEAAGLIEQFGADMVTPWLAAGFAKAKIEDKRERERQDDDAPPLVNWDEPRKSQEHGVASVPPLVLEPFVFPEPSTISPRQFLYGRHYVRGFLTCTVAAPGIGKTALAVVEALAMTANRTLLGEHLHGGPFRVWIHNGEDPLEEMQRRVAAGMLHYDLSPENIEDRLFLTSGRDVPICLARQGRDGVKLDAAAIARLRDEIIRHKIDVAILDPLVSLHGVGENDNGAIDQVCKGGLAEIAHDGRCAIEVIHHLRKSSGTGEDRTVEDARGASALIGAARSARVLNLISPADADSYGLASDDRRLTFRVDNGKANMQRPVAKATWRRLISTSLGNGTPDWPADSVQVATVWSVPNTAATVTSSNIGDVQRAIAAGEFADNSQSNNWAGFVIAEVLGLPVATKMDKARVKRVLDDLKTSGALKLERVRSARDGRDRPMVVVGNGSAAPPNRGAEWCG